MELCHSVGRIERIVSALTEVSSIFDGGVGSEAIGGLRNAANALLGVRQVVQQRSDEIATMHGATCQLRASMAEVLRCLKVLDIYGMNVKITASGLVQFMEFSDTMRTKLGQGVTGSQSLDQMLQALTTSLQAMSLNDRKLDLECARVFPKVPETLLGEADKLQAHQASLGLMARTVSTIAMAIQAELHAAIAAIQIGDRVRQRLEHVLKGLSLLDPEADTSVVLALLAALSEAAAREYARDTDSLSATLERLRAQCQKFGDLKPDGSGEGDADVLARIACSVGEAHGMLQQLEHADNEGMTTMALILNTVDEVTRRAKAIAELRLDVQHMAINISLSCRTAQEVGRPVMVIANEIRTYSNRLDAIADSIHETQRNLSEPCHRLQARASPSGATTGDLLAQFLATIGDCNTTARQAMQQAEDEAQDLRSHLSSATSALGDAAALVQPMLQVSDSLREASLQAGEADPGTTSTVQAMLDELARTYTMGDEREVHNQTLDDRYTKIATVIATAPEGMAIGGTDDDDEDDGLF
ncbi:MAG: hypothetical protein CFE35_03900 [Novosphingobium sp. PASSN1]|nr:MAG: hypothetical protein CFE35_03900 [Novosphingobium sp. PASSN1]